MISMSGRWGRPAMADLRRNISAKRRILAAPGIALALLGCGIAATIAVPPRPLLVWNASASAPMGLYRVGRPGGVGKGRSEEHTSELQSLMRISYAVFCLKKKTQRIHQSSQCNTHTCTIDSSN